MLQSSSEKALPFQVRHLIARYKPSLRAAITEAVQEKLVAVEAQGRSVTAEDISECVGWVVFGPDDERNIRFEEECWRAYKEGRSRSLRDIIDELRRPIAG